MRRRIVITGMGAITPLGLTAKDLYQNQLEGKSGAGPITWFDASRVPTTFACPVKNFDLGRYVKEPERWAHSRPGGAEAQSLASLRRQQPGPGGGPGVDPPRRRRPDAVGRLP